MKSGIVIKTPAQIEGIRASCRLAANTLEIVGLNIRPGVTTEYLNSIAAEYMRMNGATSATLDYVVPSVPVPFPKETCISVNEVICHGIASEQKLKEGDIVKVDITTVLNGFYGDTCKTFAVGKPTKKTLALMECGMQCLNVGINQVKPGVRLFNIGDNIAKYAHAYGYSVVQQFCGHGVGLEFHEEPQVPHFKVTDKTSPIMQPGMIFTIEPMINMGLPGIVIAEDHWTASTVDGKLSVQNEHTVLVTETGVEILTKL
jgi:methionyl aminopeptidase